MYKKYNPFLSNSPVYLFLIFIILLISGCTSSYLVDLPADLKIVAVTGGVAPGESILKLEIDALGNCIYYESSGPDKANCRFKQVETFKIPLAGMRSIYNTAKTNDFFGLAPEHKNLNVLDGNFAQLTITANRRTHTVRTQNIKLPRFDKIMIAINLGTPGMDRLIYNQINWFDTERK